MPRHIESRRAKKDTASSHHEPGGRSTAPRAEGGEHPLTTLQRSVGNSSTLAYLDRRAAPTGGADVARALVERSLPGDRATLQREPDDEPESEAEESENEETEESTPTSPNAASAPGPVPSPSAPSPSASTTPSGKTTTPPPPTPVSGPSTPSTSPSSEPSGPAHEFSGPVSSPSPTTSSPVSGLAPADEMDVGPSAAGPSPTSGPSASGDETVVKAPTKPRRPLKGGGKKVNPKTLWRGHKRIPQGGGKNAGVSGGKLRDAGGGKGHPPRGGKEVSEAERQRAKSMKYHGRGGAAKARLRAKRLERKKQRLGHKA